MPKTYVTFGQGHIHRVNGRIFDKDCVAAIEADNAVDGREKAFRYFGRVFCFEYFEDEFDFENLKFYKRGIINVD